MAGKHSAAGRGTGSEGSRPPPPIGPALVVEDDPIVAMSLVDTLRECGADPVETCPNTECARIMLERLSPAVLVLDSRLEDRDDGWALAELASLMGPHAPQVIFATASPERIPPHIALLGTVLGKPFAPHDLIAALAPRRHESLLGRLRGALGGDA
ncbi:response regulator [Novosphingobium flavum]|uniref:Response regulator n=1 Tax=Novosphingobium flavum TaxID=1778672 RepID=A0A7X1FP13_9SPHN|nr:response regulator [Novosphingobium flavum]MBC2664323.1 response regulator [Novosphingobium flavum]